MVTLTDAEREALHHAVLRDVVASGETVPNVHATAESILAARVQAERDRLVAVLIDAANAWEAAAIEAECNGHIDWADGVASRADALRALIAEERAR